MYLYYFNPNGYGEEAFVCAESKEKAIEYLRNTPVEKYWRMNLEIDDSSRNRYKTTIENMIIGCIEEHPIGEVVFTEIS